jgi:hypothetical protein
MENGAGKERNSMSLGPIRMMMEDVKEIPKCCCDEGGASDWYFLLWLSFSPRLHHRRQNDRKRMAQSSL